MVLYWNINSNYVDQSLEWSLYITSMSRPISALFTGAKNSINSRVRQAWKGSNHKQKKTESSSHEQNIQNGKDGEKCTDSAPKLPFLLHTSGACPLISEGRALHESRASLWKKSLFSGWVRLTAQKKCSCSCTVSCTHGTKTMCINRLILTG